MRSSNPKRETTGKKDTSSRNIKKSRNLFVKDHNVEPRLHIPAGLIRDWNNSRYWLLVDSAAVALCEASRGYPWSVRSFPRKKSTKQKEKEKENYHAHPQADENPRGKKSAFVGLGFASVPLPCIASWLLEPCCLWCFELWRWCCVRFLERCKKSALSVNRGQISILSWVVETHREGLGKLPIFPLWCQTILQTFLWEHSPGAQWFCGGPHRLYVWTIVFLPRHMVLSNSIHSLPHSIKKWPPFSNGRTVCNIAMVVRSPTAPFCLRVGLPVPSTNDSVTDQLYVLECDVPQLSLLPIALWRKKYEWSGPWQRLKRERQTMTTTTKKTNGQQPNQSIPV